MNRIGFGSEWNFQFWLRMGIMFVCQHFLIYFFSFTFPLLKTLNSTKTRECWWYAFHFCPRSLITHFTISMFMNEKPNTEWWLHFFNVCLQLRNRLRYLDEQKLNERMNYKPIYALKLMKMENWAILLILIRINYYGD